MSPRVTRRPPVAVAGVLAGVLLALAAAGAEPPAPRPLSPRNGGPQARAHSRVYQHRHRSVRVIRRTPAVMREDAARVRRGDLFSTWSNEYLE